MGPRALPMPKLLLASRKRTSIYNKKVVVTYATKFRIYYYNKFNIQEHREVSPSIPLKIKYTQQNI